jgi:hypothetical protein
LIDDDSQHEDQVDAECPEQDGFGASEVSAGAMVEDFRGNQLVGFEGCHDDGNVFPSGSGFCGIGFMVHLRITSAAKAAIE